ncbi:MAG: diguanylate cyclase [Rhizobiaceae bacterium]|nr:MAG: diguanylate cyclase [Rhizobiaceae bacterium]CAG1013394.1 putative signaling protein [Rhizobiaceae bacterium]
MVGRVGRSGTLSFSFRVVLPVMLAVCVTGVTVAGFVLWATARSDERALQRETRLAAQVIAQEMEALAEHQDYYSAWDDAITALAGGDVDWLDGNLGSELYDAATFDRIYVLDHAATPLYAMYGGGRTAPGRFDADRAAIGPMVEQLKAIGAAGALAAYDAGKAESVPHIAEIRIVDGQPAYVGVSAIMSESGEDDLRQDPGNESFLVAVRFLDGALGGQFTEKFFIEAPQFSAAAPVDESRARLPLETEAGETIGWFSWNPDRPGALILSETLPAMVAALAIVGFVLVYLLRSLLRTTSALEAGRAEAEFRANHDPLTGLANRANFNQQLEEALSATGGGGTCVALLALDLDRFKQVNDTLGHEAGDELLKEVGRRLKPLVTGADTIARLGGDEFAIIQRDVRSIDQVSTLSSNIIRELGTPFLVTGRVAEIGVSIGVVVAPAAQAARDLASKADVALYAAKAAGRNTFRVFDDSMQASADDRAALVEEMREANLPVGGLRNGRRAA